METHKNLHSRLQQKSSVCELIILSTAPTTSGIVTIIESKRGLLVALILLVALTVIITSCLIRNAKKFTENNNIQGAQLSLTQEIDNNRAVPGLGPGGSDGHSTLTSCTMHTRKIRISITRQLLVKSRLTTDIHAGRTDAHHQRQDLTTSFMC